MDDRAWLEGRLSDAPASLREAVLRAWQAADDAGAERCARAALRLLEQVERLATDRSVAVELLAADALLTLACEHVAEFEPERLAEFARSIGPGRAFATG